DWTAAAGTVTVDGTLGGTGSHRFDFTGATFVNNGTVSNNDFRFGRNGVQNVSGAGTWSGGGISIASGAIVTLTSTVTFGPSSMVVGNLNTAGTLALNGQTVIIIRPGSTASFDVEGGGTVSGHGTFQTDGTVEITSKGDFGAVFSAALLINSGTTTGKQWGNNVGFSPTDFTGPVSVPSGSTLSCEWVRTTGEVTIRGTLSGTTFTNNGTAKGDGLISVSNFVNNGTISPGLSPGKIT